MIARIMRRCLPVALALTVLAWAATPASAVTYHFYKLTNTNVENLGSQLTVDVTSGAGGTVDFKFTNPVGIPSSITDIYFDDGTLLALASITESAGVDFSQGATPGELPSGNTALPPFVTTAGFSADSNPPITASGVNSATEFVTINFTLQGGQTFADTIAALESGALRIGLHVQAIGVAGGSDSYINTPSVPEPSALAIAGLGGFGLVGYGLRRRRTK